MGDEFQLGNGSWWDTTRTTPPVSISTTLNTIASFGSTAASAGGGGGGSMVFQGGGDLTDQNMQMMGLGLSSQNLDWNQALFRGEKVESSFRSLLQEDYHQQKLYSGPSSDDSSVNGFKQINRSGFNMDQTTPFSSQAASSNDDSTITSGQNLNTGFQQVGFHGMLLPDNQSTYQNRSPTNYQFPASSGGGYSTNAAEFLRTTQSAAAAPPSGGHLHFTNNTPFWNASTPPATMADGRSSFFPVGLQAHQFPSPPSFNDNPKNVQIRGSNAITKKNSTETSNKRPRGNETPAPMPAFKAKKEKMGDRITALQQLVSPFGKTDTASVLSEAIAYIKFLHEQISVLSNPYMKNGAPLIQHHQQMQINRRKQKGLVKIFEVEGYV
ncbi:hypothetical protein CASFOL_019128 [Castilleja foliolosa]|uniref:BHLH domain-containing protein n=1 Tax=Castilleja foliolosa TaxID=1961234 RepID=A0ABD3D6A8_9LAMI